MTMTKTSMADKIIVRLDNCNVNMTALNTAEMRPCLEALCQGVIDEIVANGRITMANGDFQLLPGNFQDSHSVTITGEGDNKAFDLVGKIS